MRAAAGGWEPGSYLAPPSVAWAAVPNTAVNKLAKIMARQRRSIGDLRRECDTAILS